MKSGLQNMKLVWVDRKVGNEPNDFLMGHNTKVHLIFY